MTTITSPIELDHPAIDDLIALGAALCETGSYHHVNETPATLLPPGWRLDLHPELRDTPLRVVEDVQLGTLASYIEFLRDYATPNSVTFVDLDNGTFQTIIDYHGSVDQPAWCRFKATYCSPYTPEFQEWRQASGTVMTQEAFASFIEDHIPDIVDPAAADMAEIARSLQANVSVKFSKALRLDNGETQLQYIEEIGGSAGPKGQLKIPQVIKLGMPLFVGGEPYAIEARFKYRIKDGNLSMWIELIRPERLIADAITSMTAQVRAEVEHSVYFGTP